METVNEKQAHGIKFHRTIAYITLVVITFFCLIWFYIMLINATRSNSEMSAGFTPIPSTHLLENWNNLLTLGRQPIWSGLFNSLFVSLCCAILSTYFSSLTAYAIHVYDFKLKKAMFTFILAVMMIPTQVTALGFLQLVGKIHLDDSHLALILPTIAAPITFFYMKQYMDSALPLAIVEAARIDGSGEFKTFNNIVLPIMKPAIAVQAIFTFVTNWNNYFTPALVLHTETKKTLPILIAQLRAADYLKFDMGQVYVMITFSILPVVIVYLCLSKHIVAGAALGSVKG